MRMLCVLVVVGVAGGVAGVEDAAFSSIDEDRVNSILNKKLEKGERSVGKQWEECRQENDTTLCMNGFLFTATALKEVRSGGELEVLLSLEKSLHPHVTFHLFLLNPEDAEEVFAREEVTLEVNELRRVRLRVGDLPWKTAYLTLKAQPQINSRLLSIVEINKVHSEMEVFVQTEHSEYDNGDTVDYRAVVVDKNVDKTPKFAQVVLWTSAVREEIRLPWAEVPETGIVRGNFTFDGHYNVRVRVTSNVTSSDTSMATTLDLPLSKKTTPARLMSAGLEGLSTVFFSHPRVKGRVTLTSTDGFPLEGHCDVTIERPNWVRETPFTYDVGISSLAVEVPGGEFEFDVAEDLGAVREEADERTFLDLKVKCRHFLSGIVEEASEAISLWRSVFNVDLLSVETLPKGNSSHPQATVVLQFLVERRDGGSVEEEEPSKGLHVKLLLSEDSLKRLRPSASNFSLPIPEDGVVSLEFQVSDLPHTPWNDSVRLEVGDTVKVQSLGVTKGCELPTLDISIVNQTEIIRRGDVVQFRVRSCPPFRHLNAVLVSSKAIYSSHRFSFPSEEDGLSQEEVIELRVPQNVTEESLIFMVYGIKTKHCTKKHQDNYPSASSAVKLSVVLADKQPQIQIIDQVDGDLSTNVTFLVEGVMADSVVTLQAATLMSAAERSYQDILKKHGTGSLSIPDNWSILTWDNSPGGMEKEFMYTATNTDNEEEILTDSHRSMIFLDVRKMTSMDFNGTFVASKTFDHLTHSGTYAVSGATFTPKFGRTLFSNFRSLTIPPPPVTLSVSVAPSLILGETFEVIGYVKNHLKTPFEGQVTLDWSEGGSTEVTEHQVKVKANSVAILKIKVTPKFVGDLFLFLRSNISSRLTVTQKVVVNHPGEVLKVAKHFIVNEKRGSLSETLGLSTTRMELPSNCSPSSDATKVVFQGDILGDISALVHENRFLIATDIHGAALLQKKILLSLATFYCAKKDNAALQTKIRSLNELDPSLDDSSLSGITRIIQIGGTKLTGLEGLKESLAYNLMQLKSMQQIDGSFQEILPTHNGVFSSQGTSPPEESREKMGLVSTVDSVRDVGVIIDTAVALFAVSQIEDIDTYEQYSNFTPSDFKRGVEFLRARTVGGQVKDNFALSLVACFCSQIDELDTNSIFKMLESTASKDSDGTFWGSKLNGKAWMDNQAPSVIATAYVLMTYVNMKQLEEANEIARWLVSKKNADGLYASFEETSAAVESLSKYATFYASVKKDWPSLVKLSQECVTPRLNVSAEELFSIQAVADKDGGTLHLKICPKEDKIRRLWIMKVSQPSGYTYKKRFFEKIWGHRFFVLNPAECEFLEFRRMHNVSGGNLKKNSIPTGSVTYSDFFDPLTRSIIFFEAVKDEGDSKSVTKSSTLFG